LPDAAFAPSFSGHAGAPSASFRRRRFSIAPAFADVATLRHCRFCCKEAQSD
jgi:hypothetical protein